MRFETKHFITGVMAIGLVALAPGTLAGQEAPAQPEQCSADISPATVQAGETATELTAAFSEPLGAIAAIRPDRESGLAVAAPADLPREDMAAEGEEPRPVQMSSDGTSVSVWLNTETAQPGTHQIAFQGENGECLGEVTVEGGASSR